MYDLADLERVMREQGLCIRAVPYVLRSTVHPRHAKDYPYGRVMRAPGYRCDMLVYYKTHPMSGKFLVQPAAHTNELVSFAHRSVFDSLGDMLLAIDGKPIPPARPKIDSALVLSDRHLMPETKDMLAGFVSNPDAPFAVRAIGSKLDVEIPPPAAHFPEDLADCVRYAMSCGATRMLFDPEAQPDGGLPVY